MIIPIVVPDIARVLGGFLHGACCLLDCTHTLLLPYHTHSGWVHTWCPTHFPHLHAFPTILPFVVRLIVVVVDCCSSVIGLFFATLLVVVVIHCCCCTHGLVTFVCVCWVILHTFTFVILVGYI